MSDIKFLVDTLGINLSKMYDEVLEKELDFPVEFDRTVQEYLVNGSVEDEANNPEGYVLTSGVYLDHDDFTQGYIDVDLRDIPNPWYHLGHELEAILEFASDDRNHDKVIGYLALLNDGWKWEAIESKVIEERMINFMGLYSDLDDVVQELIANGEMDPIPSYVVYDEEATAESAENEGYFSSYEVNWHTHAVWR